MNVSSGTCPQIVPDKGPLNSRECGTVLPFAAFPKNTSNVFPKNISNVAVCNGTAFNAAYVVKRRCSI